MRSKASIVAVLLGLVLFGASTALGQATRTWVSGVGDDANPCSRTAPCKTFAGAISKTAAGGEINVLDPGGFGAVTITKSISIEATGVIAGVLVSGTNGIVVSGTGLSVVLRGLTLDGFGSGLGGVYFSGDGELTIEDCTINNFNGNGIDFQPSAPSTLSVKDTVVRHSGLQSIPSGGILVKPSGTAVGHTTASFLRVRSEGNLFGFRIEDGAKALARESVAALNLNNGFLAFSNSGRAELVLESCFATGNGQGVLPAVAGVQANGPQAIVWLSNTAVSGNPYGLLVAGGGQIVTYGNNAIGGNVADGSTTGLAPLR